MALVGFYLLVAFALETFDWHRLALGISGPLLLLSLLALFLPPCPCELAAAEIDNEPSLYHMLYGLPLSFALAGLAAFPICCRSLWHISGRMAFTGVGAGGWSDWIMFTLHHVGAVLLLDTPEVYGVNVSSITHTKQFWLSSMVWLFRTGVAVGMVRICIATYRAARSRVGSASADRVLDLP